MPKKKQQDREKEPPAKKEKPAPKTAKRPEKPAEPAKAVVNPKGLALSGVERAKRPKKVKQIIFKKPGPKKAAPVPSEPIRPAVVEKKPVVEPAQPRRIEQPESVRTAVEPAADIIKKAAPARKIAVDFPITVKDFAARLEVRPNELMKALIEKGIFVNINQSLDENTAVDIARAFNATIEKLPSLEEAAFRQYEKDDVKELVTRAPVVTFMGHVDHGKTSLLDKIRKTRVAATEHGGITQHIGAYQAKLKQGSVTFLDTPGHEAFTQMRARGANATDVVVLVVAADDGVMPQTLEAVDHAKAAGVPIVIAINKCDLPHIDLDRIKNQLAKIGLTPEDWGGKTIAAQVSAKTGAGIDHLLEMLVLEAELLELKANPNALPRGVVIESELSKGRGAAATVLVQNGTLRLGDIVVAGACYGKVKAMINDKGERIDAAPPSTPVEILGLAGVPQAGEKFFVTRDEKRARDYCLQKQAAEKERDLAAPKRVSLESLYQQIEEGQIKELKIIAKADVSGSIEALEKSLSELSTKDVKINIIHTAVGNINDSDVVLAMASNAVIIGFHVKTEPKTLVTAEKEGVEIKLYNIIYEAIADIKAAMEGMLEPIIKEVSIGKAQVRKVFTTSKAGTVAGCYVVKGKIPRNALVKLIRAGSTIYEGKISSLKRFKDDAREVLEGFECGIALVNHGNIKEGDIIEAFEIQKIARRLEK